MNRVTIEARPGWQRRVERSGLVYWQTEIGQNALTGKPIHSSYWGETGFYEFTEAEIDILYASSEVVLQALVEAGDFLFRTDSKGRFVNGQYLERMEIPRFIWPMLKHSWDMEHPAAPSVYGRFDVRFDGIGHPKFLEFNADTPTSLLEASVIQSEWFEDHWKTWDHPMYSQWNSIDEMLLKQWAHLRGYFSDLHGGLPRLHFACVEEDSGEDLMNTTYMRDVADRAGWKGFTESLFVKEIRYNKADKGFWHYKEAQNMSYPIQAIFKLYPWEWLVGEFGEEVFKNLYWQTNATTWIEPPFKMLLSNKGIWAVVWELFKDNPEVSKYLLPTFFARDKRAKELTSYAEKPILGREGACVTLVRDGKVLYSNQNPDYAKYPMIRQELALLPDFHGRYPVLGIWMCGSPEGDSPAGMGIRESDNPITGNGSTFAPHRYVKAESGLSVPTN